jgi:hypothetical protein
MANGGAKGVMTAQPNNGKPGMGRIDPSSLYSDPRLGGGGVAPSPTNSGQGDQQPQLPSYFGPQQQAGQGWSGPAHLDPNLGARQREMQANNPAPVSDPNMGNGGYTDPDINRGGQGLYNPGQKLDPSSLYSDPNMGGGQLGQGGGNAGDTTTPPEGYSFTRPQDGMYNAMMPSGGGRWAYGPEGQRIEVGGQQQPSQYNNSLYSDPNLGGGGNDPGWRGPSPSDPRTGPLPPSPYPQPQPTPQPPGQRAPNIYQTAASGINDSISGARNEMGFQPDMVSANGYNAGFSQGQGYNASEAAGRGYQAAGTSGQGYGAERVADRPGIGADRVTAGQVGNTDLSRYMNQYDDQVIDNTLSDLDRSRQLQQQNIGASASAAGAFGGARHALRESENNRNYFDQAAQTSSALRQSGFNNAQQMGLTDIQNTMQGDLANQGANLQAGSLNANLGQQRAMANQNAGNQASQFGAQASNTSGLANQASLNQARQFGSQAGNTANLANQASFNNAGQFGAQARNTAGLANQSAYNNSGQFNAGARQAAQMANQNAGLAGSQQRLSAGNQLGNLANLGFGMGQTLSGNLAQDGAMKQGMNQLLIDAAKNQYNQYTNAPYQSIGLLSQALGASPVPQTTTTSKQPGLFDYLTLGSGMM